MTFVSCTHEHVDIKKTTSRDFLQAKLGSKINVFFSLLNKHGGLYFLSHNFSVQMVLSKLKKKTKNMFRRKEKIYSVAKSVLFL